MVERQPTSRLIAELDRRGPDHGEDIASVPEEAACRDSAEAASGEDDPRERGEDEGLPAPKNPAHLHRGRRRDLAAAMASRKGPRGGRRGLGSTPAPERREEGHHESEGASVHQHARFPRAAEGRDEHLLK